jgi:hypothetical protein
VTNEGGSCLSVCSALQLVYKVTFYWYRREVRSPLRLNRRDELVIRVIWHQNLMLEVNVSTP